jgi:hypothetical protein
MTSCLFCDNQIDDATDLRVTLEFRISTGATVSVTVAVCLDCAETRRTTPAELLDLARRRYTRQEIPDGTRTVNQQTGR